jgi:molybdopterin-guanine dinucleotide biosynthesis protein A
MKIPSSRIGGVILAGGQSRRMGGNDKALVLLGGKPMLGHVTARLRPQVGWLLLSANGDPGRFAAFDLPVVGDAGEPQGPLGGILAGMDWAAAHAPTTAFIATVPADTPFVPRDLVERLGAGITTERGVAVARSRGVLHPVVGLFPVALRDELRAWLGAGSDRAARAFVAHQKAVATDFTDAPGGFDPFFNVNTADDLFRAESWLAAPFKG